MDRTTEQLIEEARAVSLDLCVAQLGNVDVMANETALTTSQRLVADPALNYAVLRILAAVVGTVTDQLVGMAEVFPGDQDVLITRANDPNFSRRLDGISAWLRKTIAELEISPGAID